MDPAKPRSARRSEAKENLSAEAPRDPDLVDNVTEAAEAIPRKAERGRTR